MRCKCMVLAILFSWSLASAALAGNIDSPGTQPSAGSGMYTLQGLYDYLLNGVTPSISGIFQEPAAGPGSTGKTTKEIYDGIKALFDAANATAGQVLAGATFFNTDPANWGPTTGTIATRTPNGATAIQPEGYYTEFNLSVVDVDLVAGNVKSGVNVFGVTGTVIESAGDAAAGDVLAGKTFSNATAAGLAGTMPNNGAVSITPGTSDQTIAAGYHDGTGVVAGDADLGAANIKSGIGIFGVTGAYPLAGVEKTGQTTRYVTGDDGDLEKGVSLPTPRFTDNGDGTVTDNLTNLVWLKDSYCTDIVGGINNGSGALTWADAITWSNSLADGSCGLTDGSTAGDWRLPNIKEFQSLIHFGYSAPPISNTAGTGKWTAGDPFTTIPAEFNWYWSSTTVAGSTSDAWYINMTRGERGASPKTDYLSVWPVRDGNNP